MLKRLRVGGSGQKGFTLIELLVVVLIVGILAAVGTPLYLAYVRDARLAEAKALAGATLTAAQACYQRNPANVAQCTVPNMASRIGIDSATGNTGDGKWTVSIQGGNLGFDSANTATGGPIIVAGRAGTDVANTAAGITVAAGEPPVTRCNFNGTTINSSNEAC